ncbi:septum site-determining protein MinC [Phosphitispora fastidiosa]|uniref:septum site-determining protein MinC n=1 Tax=Phosphitispora fastidiosa TaxID=2837202 RepID=UPI001E45665A
MLENRGPWQEAFADDNTILIQRTVRSGQSIRFDGNVVVMGDVNPGSEIVASGNIVVMGALRGVVHAGALGNETATVAAFKLQPTQLRIANHITRAPDGDYLTPEYPEIARIKDGVVVIEVYQMGQDRQTKIG